MAQRSDTALVGEWRDLLARHATVASALERGLAEHELGVSDFEVLERLAESETGTGCLTDNTPGSVRVQDLADCAHLSQSALSRVIGRLERHGLVSRSLCPDDRRGVFVCLTSAGRDRHIDASRTHREVLRSTL